MNWKIRSLSCATATCIAVSLAAGSALACSFHAYLPEETVVDQMMGSDHVVIARADPDDPFAFRAVSAIRGTVDAVEIGQLVDSTTRRRLSANPDDAVLFARVDSYGPWQRLAYLDDDYRQVIDTVIERLEEWEMAETPDRFQLFAPYHNHRDPGLRSLALRELDRAPYDILRQLDIDVSAKELANRLGSLSDLAFVPIRLLLLGLSGDAEAAPVLRAGLQSTLLTPDSMYLGAYATAFIELEGARGVAEIERHLLSGKLNDAVNRESLMEALAIHSAFGSDDVRRAVLTTTRAALLAQPELAGSAARQFGAQGEWGLEATLSTLFSEGKLATAESVISANHYLSFAAEAGAQNGSQSN